VFYDGDKCLGGGTIEEVFRDGVSVKDRIRSALQLTAAGDEGEDRG